MAASLPWRRDEKPAEISWLASDPGGTGPADHATSDDPRRYRVGTISTSNAIRRQGNRLNDSCGDVGGEGVFVPCGDFASHAQRILVFASSEHIEGDVLDDGEVEGGVVGTHAAFVAEDHVEDPVETVFDHPMT